MTINAASVESILIRSAETTDTAAITNLINAAFRIAEGFFIDDDRIDENGVNEFLRSGVFLLAEHQGALLGCVYVELKDTNPRHSYLGLLSVEPSLQQSGLGSLLMQAAEDYCRKQGSTVMDILVVNLRKELPAFYAKRGYIQTGTSPFPPSVETKIPCHFIEMSKTL